MYTRVFPQRVWEFFISWLAIHYVPDGADCLFPIIHGPN